ncbi:glycoside hydrolase domain-containing protein [Verrucosispora sp. WMMD703]|uniref:glycoside hydrolase domain-containing protein n=1 Tax=Verrucosispora sp. WMMD703 TaxID=3403463 RepID=UPI003B935AF0
MTNIDRRKLLQILGVGAAAAGAGATVASPASAAPADPAGPRKVPPGKPLADSAAVTPKPAPPLARMQGDMRLLEANIRSTGLLAASVDEWVLRAQQWVNATYGNRAGYVPAPEDGRTGWPTMFALTRALQLELGITATSDSFGPTTLSRVGATTNGSPTNIIKIMQCGLYCKGYYGEDISGTWGEVTTESIHQLRRNMGFTDVNYHLSPKEFKALLTMDAYVVVENGSPAVRSVQQWMNRSFIDQSWFYIVPADGHPSRDVAKALIWALQIELNVAGANGNFGPGTRSALRARGAISVGQHDSGSSNFIRLFQAGMIFNRYPVSFDGVFSQSVSDQARLFQQFVALPVTGKGDFQTWCSLLVSTGDTDRRGNAVDCVTTITAARAQTLYDLGYRVIGRYLTNVPNTSLDKNIKPGELQTMFNAGLRCFPIYQTWGGEASYFSPQQGHLDASLCVQAASGYGFERGTIIYHAVDFDALNTDITDYVIPHFRAIQNTMELLGHPYRIGVYGARNVCSRLAALGLTTSSFVADLSTGFSGNLGFPLPYDWAFDQITTITVGSGAGQIEIDNNIYSGRDPGQSRVRDTSAKPDVRFDMSYRSALLTALRNYLNPLDTPKVGLIHSIEETLDKVLAHDELITNLSRGYNVRKALLQTNPFWEYWKQTLEESVADAAVRLWYVYRQQLEAWENSGHLGTPPTPMPERPDSSTGVSQIFAASAIRARNWAKGRGLVPGAAQDASDWHVMWDTWRSLNENDNYNISTVPLILFEGGHRRAGISGQRLTYTDQEIEQMLASYQGDGSNSVVYGRETMGVYRCFEATNALIRN